MSVASAQDVWVAFCRFDASDAPSLLFSSSWINPPSILEPCRCQGTEECSECDLPSGRAWIDDLLQLTIRPAAKTDFWSRTYYQPEYIKANAPAFTVSVPSQDSRTFEVDLSLKAFSQFDQAVRCYYTSIQAHPVFAKGNKHTQLIDR